MNALETLERFGTRGTREVFDLEIGLRGVDAWPEAMVAAVNLAGYLDDAQTDDDLNESVEHFKSLWSAETFSHEQRTPETEGVMRAVVGVGKSGSRELPVRD